MSFRGISGVVLGYSRLDGDAARAQVAKVSLFSDFIRGRPTAFLLNIYKACSLYIVCNHIRSSCEDSTYLYTCHNLSYHISIRFRLRRKALRSLRIEL